MASVPWSKTVLVLCWRDGLRSVFPTQSTREPFIRNWLLHVPQSQNLNLWSFRRTMIPPEARLAPYQSTVRENHKPIPLGGMVWAALYLDECTQRCYCSVWAYDYMVWMPCGLGASQEHWLWIPARTKFTVPCLTFPFSQIGSTAVTYLIGMTVLSRFSNLFLKNPKSLL